MKPIEKKLKKLTTELSNRLSKSMDDITTAIAMKPTLDNLYIDHDAICRIHPKTGELCQYLVYFDEYNTIARIKYFLKAYLTTNEDVLEEGIIAELNYLINLLP